MSFVFPSWETAFSPAFHEDAKAMLEGALNKGNKPPVIQGRIEVVELSMGTQPPTLTLLEIGDLSLDRFRGILRLGYQGDAWLEVRCRVQANPLSHNPNLLPSSTLPLSTPLLASQPLLVPMTLRLSKLHLRAILILVNVDVSSTFDSVEVIRGYLQQEIEGS
ncbi:ERMES complex subunit [Saitozyma podzolica]|uniref:ERMES complex subunit n=1 Tax=Saitozyma podzolica TaxID=1890683 RepID=A0A427YQL7_9TREE|nr:ERMES complex subunit [Saitozyma podzolica]